MIFFYAEWTSYKKRQKLKLILLLPFLCIGIVLVTTLYPVV